MSKGAPGRRIRVGILISGRGSNMAALIEACRQKSYPAEISVVISNRPRAAGLVRATEAGIPALSIDHTAFPDRASFEDALTSELKAHLRGMGLQRWLHASAHRSFRRQMARPAPEHPPIASARLQGARHPCPCPGRWCSRNGMHRPPRARGNGRRTHCRPGRGSGLSRGHARNARITCSGGRTPTLSPCPEADDRRDGENRRRQDSPTPGRRADRGTLFVPPLGR